MIERPFTITITLPNSTARPVVVFPAIPGFTKSGASASQTTSEINGKNVVSQVITQDYLAQAPGIYRVVAFMLTIDGISVRSAGATLTVRAMPGRITSSASTSAALALAEKGGAFLSLTASAMTIYAGQGVMLKLTFYVAENYPYELRFEQLEEQLRAITKQIRPPGAWEENAGISEVKPLAIQIRGRPFREYRLYQSTFFPLHGQTLHLPAVALSMQRLKQTPVPATTTSLSATQTEVVTFSSQPVAITVRPLPAYKSVVPVPVGVFRLVEQATQMAISPGQSTAYEFRIEGEGNIGALPPPMLLPRQGVDVFPPDVRQTINRAGNPLSGQKTFRYFIVPKQTGDFKLANLFQWIYFDPQTERYDSLRSRLTVRVSDQASFPGQTPDSVQTGLTESDGQNAIYTNIGQIDSSHQPLNFPVLVRALANVLILAMIMCMIYIFFKK